MPERYQRSLTPNAVKRRECAERDGAWLCTYCGLPLVNEVTGEGMHWEVRGPCPGGHRGIVPCDQGCPTESWRIVRGYTFATLDHVLPRSRGGSDNLVNLVLSCVSCNSSKGKRTPGEWLYDTLLDPAS